MWTVYFVDDLGQNFNPKWLSFLSPSNYDQVIQAHFSISLRKKNPIASQKSNLRTPTVLLSSHYSQTSYRCLGSSEHRACMREYLINVILSIYAHKYWGGGWWEEGRKEGMPTQGHIIEATGNLNPQDQIANSWVLDGISEPSIWGKQRKKNYALAPTRAMVRGCPMGTTYPAFIGCTCVGTSSSMAAPLIEMCWVGGEAGMVKMHLKETSWGPCRWALGGSEVMRTAS